MTANASGIDFNELVQIVAREVDEGQRAARLAASGVDLHVAEVWIRFGQLAPPCEPGEDQPPPFLLLDRYPPAQRGWEFEIAFRAGPEPPQARGADGGWLPVTPTPRRTLLDVLGNMPVEAIKGVAGKWASKLERIGITTIGELSAATPDDLQSLLRGGQSRHPLELQFKASLLNVAPPSIPPSAVDSTPLSRLIGKTPAALRALVGEHRVSLLAMEQLATVLSLLFTTIDFRVLGAIKLQELRTPMQPA